MVECINVTNTENTAFVNLFRLFSSSLRYFKGCSNLTLYVLQFCMTRGTGSGQNHKTGSGEKNADFYGKAAIYFSFHFVFAHCLQN